jgi:hypothetical protein
MSNASGVSSAGLSTRWSTSPATRTMRSCYVLSRASCRQQMRTGRPSSSSGMQKPTLHRRTATARQHRVRSGLRSRHQDCPGERRESRGTQNCGLVHQCERRVQLQTPDVRLADVPPYVRGRHTMNGFIDDADLSESAEATPHKIGATKADHYGLLDSARNHRGGSVLLPLDVQAPQEGGWQSRAVHPQRHRERAGHQRVQLRACRQENLPGHHRENQMR